MSEHDFIHCASAAKPKGLVGRDFIACSSDLVGPMHEAYRRHRATAKSRGITFELNFDQWASAWLEQNRWSERGTRSDQYVMGRTGDFAVQSNFRRAARQTGQARTGSRPIISGHENR